MNNRNKKIYIVHSVDTEGPLYESQKETFKRIEELCGIKVKNQSSKILNNIIKGNYFTGKLKKKVSKIFNPHLINYNYNWSLIKKMLNSISKPNFRNRVLGSDKKGYILTWHCVDHVNYEKNPRKRELGYGKIFKFYNSFIKRKKLKDKIQFHFHPMSIFKEANRNATLYFRNDNLYQILCRRIIDHNWFPVVNRAGFHVERPDSHWFLEQFIPFDLSNTNKNEIKSKNLAVAARGRDWRRAPKNWEIYNPDKDYYQIKGKCRRYIGRILSVLNRTESIDKKEVLNAFKRANSGKRTLLAVTGHDFRNLETEINFFLDLIKKASRRYPNVKFYFVDAISGFQKTLGIKNSKNKRLKLNIKRLDKISFKISTKQGKVFGPQPFLALKLKNGNYVHDNLDFSLKKNEWYYSLTEDTVGIKDIKTIAIGAADKLGNYDVQRINF
jgi:hypothetical protein